MRYFILKKASVFVTLSHFNTSLILPSMAYKQRRNFFLLLAVTNALAYSGIKYCSRTFYSTGPCCHINFFKFSQGTLTEGELNTIDFLFTNQFISAPFNMEKINYFFQKQASSMRRSIVLSLPLQLVFPGLAHRHLGRVYTIGKIALSQSVLIMQNIFFLFFITHQLRAIFAIVQMSLQALVSLAECCLKTPEYVAPLALAPWVTLPKKPR